MKGFRSVVMTSVFVAFAATAWARGDGDSIAGTVQKVDQQSRKLVLDNGRSYSVASNVKIDNLQPGDKVNVTTDDKGTSVTRIEQTDTQSLGSKSMDSQTTPRATDSTTSPSMPND